MENVDINFIRKNLGWGDLSRIAVDCGVSQQKVSKILCGLVQNPDPVVIASACAYAEKNMLRISAIKKNLLKLSKYDRKNGNAISASVSESGTR